MRDLSLLPDPICSAKGIEPRPGFERLHINTEFLSCAQQVAVELWQIQQAGRNLCPHAMQTGSAWCLHNCHPQPALLPCCTGMKRMFRALRGKGDEDGSTHSNTPRHASAAGPGTLEGRGSQTRFGAQLTRQLSDRPADKRSASYNLGGITSEAATIRQQARQQAGDHDAQQQQDGRQQQNSRPHGMSMAHPPASRSPGMPAGSYPAALDSYFTGSVSSVPANVQLEMPVERTRVRHKPEIVLSGKVEGKEGSPSLSTPFRQVELPEQYLGQWQLSA